MARVQRNPSSVNDAMPNAFDEFDVATAPAPANAFDEFDRNPFDEFDAPKPETDDQLIERVGDVQYDPTPEEFQQFKAAKERRPLSVSRMASTALGAGQQVLGDVAGAVWEMAKNPLMSPKDRAQTGAEAVGRGTYDLGLLARKMQPLLAKVGQDYLVGGGGIMNEESFLAAKTSRLNQESFPEGMRPGVTEWFGLDVPVPKELLGQWRKEYQGYKRDAEYQHFLEERIIERDRVNAALGKETVVPEVVGTANRKIAEGLSYVADPATLITMGAGAGPKVLTKAASELAGAGVRGAGVALENAGELATRAAALPERAAGRIAEAVTGSAEAAEKAEKTVRAGALGATAGIPLGMTVPGLSETAAAITAGKVAGGAAEVLGEGAQAVGRQLPESASRYGLLERLSKDATAPQWLRSAAGGARALDPALAVGVTAARGAAEGAAVGGALGGLADGEEGFAAGVGSGGVLGASGRIVNRFAETSSRRVALEDADLARWLAGKSADEVANIKALNLSRENALKFLDTERLARGVNDVDVRYVRDKQFREQFGGIAKGAQVVEGDRPVIFINTDFTGPRSLFHETLHALDALEGLTPERERLNRVLFDQVTGDGTVLSRGLFNGEDLKNFESQYRARLPEVQRTQWDTLPPDQRAAKMQGEVRAESFANLIDSSRSDFLTSRSLTRRVADSLLLAEQDSFLGRMRGRLENLGVKFDEQGQPSDLFAREGVPISNSPAVNAALRDYLRAKQNHTRRLALADDDAPSVVVRPYDLAKPANRAIVDAFKDNDVFAKHPDGSVQFNAGIPILLSEREIKLLQSKRVELMSEALGKVPDAGDARALRQQENGAWTGKHLTDAQVNALRALPDDILSPSMKERIVQMNTLLRRGDGTQILLDYNAALKGGKYSSGISSATRTAVPIDLNISKAGNFYLTTLDTSHFFRKLREWRSGKPKAFEAWHGDTEAFLRDAFKYLDNHARGLSGSVGLDPDPVIALDKKNRLNDFFNVHKKSEVNPIQLSGKGNRDNLIRARRFDRINRITEGAGDKFPVNYQLQQINFLPESSGTVSRQLRDLQDGRRPAVLVTGRPVIPAGLRTVMTPAGRIAYHPGRLNPEMIQHAVAQGSMGSLLGYGIDAKPANAIGTVVVRDAAGREVQSVVTDAASAPEVTAAAQRLLRSGDTVSLEHPDRVLRERVKHWQLPAGRPEAVINHYRGELMARALPLLEQAQIPAPVSRKLVSLWFDEMMKALPGTRQAERAALANVLFDDESAAAFNLDRGSDRAERAIINAARLRAATFAVMSR
jgi:hypothetical protein